MSMDNAFVKRVTIPVFTRQPFGKKHHRAGLARKLSKKKANQQILMGNIMLMLTIKVKRESK